MPAKERERLQETCTMYTRLTHGKGKLAWDTWPNCLVLRLSLQSENETNDPLKSGPPLIYLVHMCYIGVRMSSVFACTGE